MDWDGIEQENHNPLRLHRRRGRGETGFTNEAGYGFVGSAIRNGRRIIMVVGATSRPCAREAVARFHGMGFRRLAERPLYGPGALVGEARVRGGTSRAVRLIAPGAGDFDAGRRARGLPLSIRYKGPLRAPSRGAEVATLIAKVPGLPDERLPLIAADAVDAGGPVARMRDGLLSLVGR
jgi:D-alanyl-D-alanine carboxypeptidase (penicillin-binding protein 5/6)